MQTITTKFIGPTNTKGSRVKATCWLGSVTVGWDHALNTEQNHEEAAQAMVDKLNDDRSHTDSRWSIVAQGHMPDGKGYAFIIDLN